MNLGRYDDALTELDTATRLEPAHDFYRARTTRAFKTHEGFERALTIRAVVSV